MAAVRHSAGHPGRGRRGRPSPVTHLCGGRKSKLFPDEGRLPGEWNLCPVCARQPLWACRTLCLCVFGQALLCRGPSFLLPTGAQRPEAGRWKSAADVPSSPRGENLLLFPSEVWAKMPRILPIPFLPSSSDRFQNVTSIILIFIAP